MDVVEPYVVMARYNAWMNRKLYAAADTLTDDDRRRDLGAFFHSLHGTLNHLVLTDRAWLVRFTENPALLQSLDGTMPEFSGRLDQELYSDFATLRRERDRTDADIVEWVQGLTPETLAAPITYYSVAYARSYEHPLWWAVTHFFNHQTHHRGQATTLLLQLGCDLGTTDLVDLLRNEPS
jgi:uncharacterized damage-inducible protein DinB